MRRCTTCGLDKPEDAFYRYSRRRDWCIECAVRPKVKHEEEIGYVLLSHVWVYLDELARRVGQQEAARLAGVSADTMRSWCRKRVRRIQKRHFARVVVALRDLRARDVWDAPTVGRPMRYNRPATA